MTEKYEKFYSRPTEDGNIHMTNPFMTTALIYIPGSHPRKTSAKQIFTNTGFFGSKGIALAIFHNQLAVVLTSLTLLKSYMFRTHDLEFVVNRLVNYMAEMSLNSGTVREFLAVYGQILGHTISGVGQALEHVIVGSGQTMTQELNNSLKGPLQMLVYLAILKAFIMGDI
uniref:Uncharacterized protein n=1 Tax=Romanomermis culicivorax TaxID=13658 RepID=A0A915IFE6_ROMCU